MNSSALPPAANGRHAKPRFGLFAWVNVGVTASVLLIVLPLLFLVDRFAQRYAERQAGESLNQIAWQMRDALDRGMAERYEDIHRLASGEVVVNSRSDPLRVRRAFDRMQGSVPELAWIGLAGLDGKVSVATAGLLDGVDVSARPWFQGAQQSPYVGDVHAAVLLAAKLPQAKEPWRFVDLAMPVRSHDGKVFAILGAHLSWAWVRAMQEALIEPRLQSLKTDIWIVKADGEVLLGPVAPESAKLSLTSIASARAGQRGYIFEKWPDGKRYATSYIRTQGYQRYPGLGWIVLARQPQEVAFAAFAELQTRLLIVSVVVCALVLVLANLLARRIARPLDALARAADRYGAGDLQATIPLADDYSEAYVLSRAVADMVLAEQRHNVELEEINASLEARVDERTRSLHEANEHLGHALFEQASAENAARESEAILADILRNANEAYVSMNAAGLITGWNSEAERIFGWSHAEVLGRALSETIIPAHQRQAHHHGMAHFLATGQGRIINKRIELIALRRDGSEFPVELTTSVVKRGDDLVISGLMHDISERKAMEMQLERQALQDALTELPNRRALLDRLPNAMARADRWNKGLALFFLDLDGFKKINDSLGHDAGDELLRQFARRLESCVRQTDTVARLAGDEFTVLLEALVSADEDAYRVASKIIGSMQAPFLLGEHEVQMSTSIGIAMYAPHANDSVDGLLAQADTAMYVAKRSGKNRWHMSAEISATSLVSPKS